MENKTMVVDAIDMCEENIISLIDEVKIIKEKIGRKPKFVIINASDNEANSRYIKGKIKEGEKAGLDAEVIKFERNCTETDVLNVINMCNNTNTPVILQLPTFEHLDSKKLINEIKHNVDADGFSREWIGEVNLGNDKLVAPATPKGVINILEYHKVELEGKNVLVIGKSNHVGKPLCSMLMNRGATVINANSKTKDLTSLVRISDVIISCVGKPNLINPEDVKEDSVLIGVGFTYIDRKQVLDFDVDQIVRMNKARLVSNRINCTGKATINSLISNVVYLYKLNYEIE